jgi:hypothetical protein
VFYCPMGNFLLNCYVCFCFIVMYVDSLFSMLSYCLVGWYYLSCVCVLFCLAAFFSVPCYCIVLYVCVIVIFFSFFI